jgi:site-specific DNA-methyltransferase (adenine-specific)
MCRIIVKPGGVAAIFTDWRQLGALFDAIQWGGWVLRGVVPWDKQNARPQPARPRQQCEFIVWASNGPLSISRAAPYLPGLLSCPAPATSKRSHQTEKPLPMMRQLVHICEDGGRIIDPFAGSGTTICAAALEGFSGLGIKISTYHAKKAQARLEKSYKEDSYGQAQKTYK